jgi:hypothetical protein
MVFFVIFVCRFSHLHYYNINKLIKLIYACHAYIGTSLPPAVFRWHMKAFTVVKKGWSLTHPIRKAATHLLGWRVLSSERRFYDDWSFYSSLSFFSLMPWYTCRALTNSIMSSNLYLFWVWSLFFWFLFLLDLMLL